MVWIFYYGSQPTASHRRTLDSFALHKEGAPSRSSRYMSQHPQRPDTIRSSSHQPQMYNANQLAGFETSSPVTGFAGGAAGQQNRASASAFPQPASTPGVSAPGTGIAESQQQTEFDYPYRAKAIYSYEANPDDSNEVSFAKHEILEVSDVSGRWWQAKKENGDKGIIPSNYVRSSIFARRVSPSTNSFLGRPHIIVELTHRTSVRFDGKPFTTAGGKPKYRKRFSLLSCCLSLLYAASSRVCEKRFTRRGVFFWLLDSIGMEPYFLFFLSCANRKCGAALARLPLVGHVGSFFPFFSCFGFCFFLFRTRVTIPKGNNTLFRFLLICAGFVSMSLIVWSAVCVMVFRVKCRAMPCATCSKVAG